ncbi:fatty acid synthase S-acetyltransferase [Astrocystis sublimbata]|nr:fatty acid synthase S-acetyltransferase [Astrocystis sublimbata]
MPDPQEVDASLHTSAGQSTTASDGSSPSGQIHTPAASLGSAADGLSYDDGGAMPIAICGMALRLPGGLSTPQQLWEFLLNKGDARGRVPESRYNVSAFHSTSGKPGSVATEYGYFLDESVDLGALDTSFFTMPKTEVQRADPQQRMLFEVARECFDDSGVTNWRGKTIGCYVGSFGEDWVDMFAKDDQPWGLYRVTGYGDFALSNRLSYEMDLQGPSITLRTACSSALTCLNEACMAISRGDCESALVGGVNLIMSPTMTMAMTEQGVLSPDGSCKTFSAEANGYARGEAITAIFIKPLCDAIRDGNPIRAVIRGTSANVDGKTPGLSQPSTDAQEALIRRAYQVAGISDPGNTGVVECHGTGTSTGDPIEAKAVARVFGERGVYITSVKPNLGHGEGASGLTSLMKMVLSLEHRTIPPNIKFGTPNPSIPFDSAKLTVPVEPTPWPEDRVERASVNSFGIGGANAHAIIDSAASFNISSLANVPAKSPQLLLFSARTANSLERMVAGYEEWVGKYPERVCDLAYTLAHRREQMPHRTSAVVNKGIMGKASVSVKASAKPNIIMVFTGQGAHWPLMGRELLQSNDVFRASIRSLDEHLKAVATPDAQAPYSIEEELLKPARKSKMNEAALSQPLCTAIQVALVDTFRSLDILPDAVVGHSSGEIAAAYASGALTAREAIIAAHHRGAVAMLQTKAGAMAAIGMSWVDTEAHLADTPNVVIACDNSPNSVTISGDTSAVKDAVARIKVSRPGVLARMLVVDKAYHSQHMAEIGDDYLALIGAEVRGVGPGTPFFSSVTGKLLEPSQTLGSEYWKENLISPVRFCEAVNSILQHDVGKDAIFLEIGPHSALAGPLRQICTSGPSPSTAIPHVPAMTRNQDCVVSFLSSLGKLHSLGASVNLQSLIPGGRCIPDLPRYPWNHQGSHWFESRLCQEWRQRQYAYHDLLGSRVVSSTQLEPVWRNVFHLRNAPWVADHKVNEDIVFPAAAYLALAGEAVRQITGINEGYKIRNIDLSMALVIPDGKPIEIITTFRPCRLTKSLNSKWWEFTVTSYNKHSWHRHCTGEVSAISDNQLGGAWKPPVLSRKLMPQRWYEAMFKRGLCLGPSFQTMQDIETATVSPNEASATVLNGRNGDEANYHIHPTVIDGMLQLLGASAVHGIARKLKHRLPTGIDMISVVRCASDLTTLVSATETSNSSLVGEGRCVSTEGSIVLEASGVHLTPVNSEDGLLDAHSAARYAWGNSIEFLTAAELIRPVSEIAASLDLLEELSTLCLHSSSSSLSASAFVHPSMIKYESWIRTQLPDTADSRIKNKFTIEELANRLSETSAAPVAAALVQVTENLGLLLSGQMLESVVAQETMTALYGFINEGQMDLQDFIQALGHSKPNLRVLELGIGRPPQSENMLNHLTLRDGNVLCSKYTITSPSFIIDKNKKEGFANMEYVSLDISKDLAEQSFEDRQYDFIIASNVLHTTEDLQKSLVNIRKLLAPQGRLLLQELRPSTASTWAKYIFGSQPGWWKSGGDDTSIAPWLSTETWEVELLAAGFNDLETLTKTSGGEIEELNTTIIAKPVADQTTTKQVTLLCDSDQNCRGFDFPDLFIRHFENAGYEVSTCKLEDHPTSGQQVVSLLDMSGPFLSDTDSDSFDKLKTFLGRIGDSGILWVTLSCQRDCSDPRFAQVLGFARTMRSEMLIDFATCEIESAIDSTAKQVVRVFSEFQRQRSESTGAPLKPDYEYLVENGQIKVGRFYPFALSDELLTSQPDDRASLRISMPGKLNTLNWAWHPREEPIHDEVEIEVHHAGLNFRDILVATAVIELPGESRRFGLEAAGVVTRVGPQAKNVKVGDRAVCLSLQKQALTTHITVADFAVARIPDSLSFEEAATMLVPFVTAIHSLQSVGGLTNNQSVLIHSACGGVGLAAVQVAQMLGAEVFVTVGNDEKVQFLMEKFHIPRERILHSRDSSFAEDLMRNTQGEGVDVVLNSLSGELLHATWSCVAEFGKMVEIGKRDLIEGGKLDMQPFLANRTYSCVDIDQLWKRPAVLHRLIMSTLEFYELGHTSPIRPIQTYSANEILDAIRYMQKGAHIGRVGIEIREPTGNQGLTFDAVGRNREVSLAGAGSYLLVGGLGGLGRAIATWMAELGARELVFLSRSAGTDPRDESFVSELASMGCSVKLVKGDVTKLEDVDEAIAAATTPLKGIIQMSMVLRDQNFESMSFEEWTAATSPKVQGTWNLHHATSLADIKLDFFILFSSLSGLVGQPGQANYASANAFLDAFAACRTDLGLAASVIDIGAMEDIGFISQNPGLMNKMKATGFRGLTEQQLLDALVVAMAPNQASSKPPPPSPACSFAEVNAFALGLGSTMPLHSAGNRTVWRNDRRMAVYHNGGTGGAGGAATGQSDETLKVFLSSAKADPSVLATAEASKLLAVEIGKKLFDLLLKPHEDLNTACSLVDLGLDSLVAIELRTWWKQVFAFDISVLEMLGMGSLEGLGQHAIEGLRSLYSGEDKEG